MTDNTSVPLNEAVLQAIRQSRQRLTFRDLMNMVSQTKNVNRQALKKAVRDLIAKGKIKYTYQDGCSFLEISFDQVHYVSPSIIIVPSWRSDFKKDGAITIKLNSGISFGGGDHPTTRLALRAIDQLSKTPYSGISSRTMLDIGTGSGILAIAMGLLFPGIGVAIDMDPCAVHEAKTNIQSNGLCNRIEVILGDTPNQHQPFDLICANLRLPTLMQLRPLIKTWLNYNGYLILSGFKNDESASLIKGYRNFGFTPRFFETEKDWSGIIFNHCFT